MAVGLSAAHTAGILNLMRGMNYVGFIPWFQLHLGEPGPSGTDNPSAVTVRVSPAFGAPSGGVMTADPLLWEEWAGPDESITHVSVWDAGSGGTFKQSAAVEPGVGVQAGDTLRLIPTVTLGPLGS